MSKARSEINGNKTNADGNKFLLFGSDKSGAKFKQEGTDGCVIENNEPFSSCTIL